MILLPLDMKSDRKWKQWPIYNRYWPKPLLMFNKVRMSFFTTPALVAQGIRSSQPS